MKYRLPLLTNKLFHFISAHEANEANEASEVNRATKFTTATRKVPSQKRATKNSWQSLFILLAAFFSFSASAGVCQFTGADLSAWNVSTNWGGDCALTPRVPNSSDRAEIVNKIVTLPSGITEVGDLYLLNSDIRGNSSFDPTVSTLNVVAANNIGGGIAWGSGSYAFTAMTLQLRATGSNRVPATSGPLLLSYALVQLYGAGANFGTSTPSALVNESTISTNDLTAVFSLNGDFALAQTSILRGRLLVSSPSSVSIATTPSIIVESYLDLGTNSLSLTGAGLAKLVIQPGAELRGSGGTLAGGTTTLTFPNIGGQRLVKGAMNITGNVVNGSATLQPRLGESQSATITITGNYAQSGSGTLNLVSDFNQSGQTGNVTVNGTATLSPSNGGILDVEIEQISPPPPPITRSSGFSYTNLIGTFATVTVFPPGTAFTTTYGPTNVDLNLLAPSTAISPTLNAYPNTQYGNFASQTFTVTNNSGAASTMVNTLIAFTGSNSDDFDVFQDNCTGIVADGASCTVVIHFIPATHPVGDKSANFTITINGQSAAATLSGAPVSPSGGFLAPGSFETVAITGPTTLGSTTIRRVAFYNVGLAPLNIISSTALPPFSNDPSNCQGLAAGASCFVVFGVTPTMVGPLSTFFSVTSNFNVVSVAATAVGTATLAPTVVTTVSPLTIPLSGTARATLTIANPNTSTTLNFVNVTSRLNVAQLQVAPPPNAAHTCAGNPEIVAFPGATSASISILSIAPSTSCTFSYDLKSTNTAGVWALGSDEITSNEASATFSTGLVNLIVTGAPLAPTITSGPTYPSGTVGTFYSTTFAASANPVATWSVTLGTIPAGLMLNSMTGVLSGTPTTAATSTFTIQAANGTPPNATQALAITINSGPTFAPTSLSFGNVSNLTNSIPQTITVTNSSASPVTVSPPTTGNAEFSIGTSTPSGCETAIPALSVCAYPVTFNAPNMLGNYMATFTLVTSAGTIAIPLAGAATLFNVPSSPLSMDFGSITVGQSSPPTVFTFINNGLGSATINIVDLAGSDGGDFTLVSTTCGTVFLSLATCTATVQFAPLSVGSKNGSMRLQHGSQNNGREVRGVAFAAALFPTITSSPTLPQATVGIPYNTTFTASGSPASTWSVTLGTLPPGLTFNSTTGVLSGTPTIAGTYTFTTQAANGNLPNASQMATMIVASPITPAPTSLNFDDTALGTASVRQIVTLSNNAAATITITSVNKSPGEFRTYPPSCGTSIPAMGTCTIEVDFSPGVSSTPTSFLGTLDINTSAGNLSVQLTARAFPYDVSNDGNLNFPVTAVGQNSANQTVTYTNNALGTANVLAVTITGADANQFQLISNTCTSGTFDPSANCTATVRFSPTTIGAKAANITLSHAGRTYSAVALSATATSTPSAPTITSGTPPLGNVGTPYNFTFTASGSPASTWSVTLGTLPPGLTLNSTNGVLSGSPTMASAYNFTIQASNGIPSNATQAVFITINPPQRPIMVVAIAPSSVATATNATVTLTLSPFFGEQSALSISSGSVNMPSGLVIQTTPAPSTTCGTSNTILAGGSGLSFMGGIIPPVFNCTITFAVRAATFGTYTINILAGAITASGQANTNTSSTSIIVTASGTAPTITSALPPNGTVGVPYNHIFVATGSPASTWSFTIGGLPAGLSLDSITGAVSGIPTAANLYGFSIQAVNGVSPKADQTGNIIIVAGPLTFAPTSLTFGNTALGTASVRQIVTLSNSSNAVIAITGTTNSPGEFGHYIPSCGTSIPAMGTCTIEVDFSPGVSSMLGSYPSGQLNINTAAGNLVVPLIGNDAVAYNLTSSANLSFPVTAVGQNSANQTVTYTNNATGTANVLAVTITGTDANQFQLISNTCTPGTFNPSATCTATVRFSPTTIGAKAANITLSHAGRTYSAVALNGTPTAATVAPLITSSTPPSGTVGAAYSTTFVASGNPASTWGLATGNLPFGLNLFIATGVLTGTPTLAGTYNFTVQAANGTLPNATQMVTIVIAAAAAAPLVTSGPTYPSGSVGAAYSTTFVASGSPASTWSLISGMLPTGLILNGVTGVLSGIPTQVGVSGFVIGAANGTLPNASQNVSISIAAASAAPVITSAAPPPGQTAQSYGFFPSATGTAPIAWTIASGGLPPGLNLSPTSGAITGTPTMAGSFFFTLRATNMAGQANQGISINITTPIIPAISVSPASLNFGLQNLGTVSPAQTVTVSNTGNSSFTINSITSIGDFAYTTNCPSNLAPQASCTINFTFSPLTPGALSGLASVNTTALAGSGSISLNGNGISEPRANIVVNPTSVAFGNQAQGTASAAQIIFISNTGLANLALSSITLNAGSGGSGGSAPSFTLSAPPASANPNSLPSCGGSLAPGTSCALGVSFAPAITTSTTTDTQSGSITISHNATLTGLPGTSSISLAGNATPRREALIRLSGQPSFGDQVLGMSSAPQPVSVTNTGTIDLTVGTFSISPTNANTTSSDFQVSGGCGTLIPNANCVVNLSFSPSGAIGSKAATLNIASNAANASAGVINLSGTAIAIPAPVVRLSSTSLGFGTAIIGGASSSQALTLSNAGGLPLRIGSISSSNSEYDQTNNCPSPPALLNPMQSCNISITFTPLRLGNRQGSLTINSNAIPATNTVPLTGVGCRFFTAQQQLRFVTGCGAEE